ncbi:hypothetical protein Ancab_035629 [Ancistrocladus abbreviatus]
MKKPRAHVADNFCISSNQRLVQKVSKCGPISRLITVEVVKAYVVKGAINKAWKLLNEEWNEYIDAFNIDFILFFLSALNYMNYFSTLNAVKIGGILGEVLSTDKLSGDRLLDRHFLQVRVLIDMFSIFKKSIVVYSEDGREIIVQLKYEQLTNFCYACVHFGYKKEVCHLKSTGSFSNDRRATDLSDKHAAFKPIQELHYGSSKDIDTEKDYLDGFLHSGGRERSCRDHVGKVGIAKSSGPLYRPNLTT